MIWKIVNNTPVATALLDNNIWVVEATFIRNSWFLERATGPSEANANYFTETLFVHFTNLFYKSMVWKIKK